MYTLNESRWDYPSESYLLSCNSMFHCLDARTRKEINMYTLNESIWDYPSEIYLQSCNGMFHCLDNLVSWYYPAL